jgi:flagellar assembly protein FliH
MRVTSLSERVRPLSLPELSRPAPPASGLAPAAPPDAAGSIREAHRIGRAIVARAQAQAGEIQTAAREEGLEIGTRLALEREGAALRNAAEALGAAAARYDALADQLAGALRRELPGMAVAIAERVLRRELSVRPETLALVIRDAIAALTPAVRLELHLHPADLATVERHRALLEDALGSAELKLQPAPAVGAGGCFIETESFTLGAGVLEQLERALALLKEEAP